MRPRTLRDQVIRDFLDLQKKERFRESKGFIIGVPGMHGPPMPDEGGGGGEVVGFDLYNIDFFVGSSNDQLPNAILHSSCDYLLRHYPLNHDHSGVGGASDDTGGPVDHANIDNVTSDQHHAQAHVATHEISGNDPFDYTSVIGMGTVYFASDAWIYHDGTNLAFYDAVAGLVTLSEIAISLSDAVAENLGIAASAGVSGDASRVDHVHRSTIPSGTSFPASSVAGDQFLRTDLAGGLLFTYDGTDWQPELKAFVAAELTLEQLLLGTLNTSGASATTRTLIRKNATDNKGCFVENVAWTEQATRIEKDDSPEIYVYIYTSGGNIVLDQDSGVDTSDDNSVDVNVDGVLDGAWDQTGNDTYTITGVAAGIHKIELVGSGGAGDFTYFYSITFPINGDQQIAIAGDVVEIIASLPPFFTTFGIGRDNSGAACPFEEYGEGVLQRLPLGDTQSDQDPDRGSVALAGLTTWSANPTAMLRDPQAVGGYQLAGYKFGERPLIDDTIKVSATAGTRGFRIDNAGSTIDTRGITFYQTTAQMMWCTITPLLCRVTALGTDPHTNGLVVGDLVLCVITHQNHSADEHPYSIYSNHGRRAMGLYKLVTL